MTEASGGGGAATDIGGVPRGHAPGRLAWGGSETTAAPCLACGDDATRPVTVRVANPVGRPAVLTFFRCGPCGSLQAEPFTPPEDYLDADVAAAARFYVHVGAGIDEMTQLATAAKGLAPKARTFLDVGCGYGFSVDFAGRVLDLDATGIDPSAYARVGARALAAPVVIGVLGYGSTLDGRQFDIVYSSEVLEHVDDPRAFLATLARAVTGDGVVVLTTPAAEAVVSDELMAVSIAILSPGYHRCLFSAHALRQALAAAGFSSVVVRRDGLRLIAAASRRRAVETFRLERDVVTYRRYLSGLAAAATDPDVRLGALYRLYKDHVNAGEILCAADIRGSLVASVGQRYGLDIESPRDVAMIAAGPYDFRSFGDRAPYFLGPFLYLRAGEILAASDDPALARELLGTSRRLAEAEAAQDSPLFLESRDFYPHIRLREAATTLAAGDEQGARAHFADLAGAASDPATSWLVPPDFSARSAYQAALLDLRARHPRVAVRRFRDGRRLGGPHPRDVGAALGATRSVASAAIHGLLHSGGRRPDE